MIHTLELHSLFGKPIKITEGDSLSRYDEVISLRIGEDLHDARLVNLIWDDELGEFVIEYTGKEGYFKRDILGVHEP